MKRIFLIIIVVAFMTNNGWSQDTGSDLRRTLQVGLKVGTNYSNVIDTKGDGFNPDYKFGIVTGIFLAVPIKKYFGFQPEILFSQKGFKTSGTLLTNDYKFKHTSSFIDVPLLFSVKPCGLVNLLFGPQYSYLMVERDVFESGSLSIDQQKQFKNDNIRKNLLCLLGGIDINVNHLVFGIRAGWDITNNNGDGTATDPRYKNVWYQVTVGLKSYK